MEEIEADIMAGRYALACRKLEQLLSWKADPKGGLIYLLGSCELARGRLQNAQAAWARVVPGSAFSEKAIRGRVRLFHESGELASAERLIQDAAGDRRNDRTALLVLLVPTFIQQGRIDEAVRLIELRWEDLNRRGEGALEPAILLLRQHIELTSKEVPVETLRAFLDGPARLDPEDDRVWLARANLAIRTGAFDEATRWLDACQRLRENDVPVWRTRLALGIASNQIDLVHQALEHVPTDELTPARFHQINVWIASKRGDRQTKGRELERLLAADPSDLTALDRLAQLADQNGEKVQATELRRKKTEMAGLKAHFRKLHERNQPIRDAMEMAHLAERLGRRFEARVFLTLAVSEEPGRDDLKNDLDRLGQDPLRRKTPGADAPQDRRQPPRLQARGAVQ
jgi:tetratricopeptide (TPR) repeat protein